MVQVDCVRLHQLRRHVLGRENLAAGEGDCTAGRPACCAEGARPARAASGGAAGGRLGGPRHLSAQHAPRKAAAMLQRLHAVCRCCLAAAFPLLRPLPACQFHCCSPAAAAPTHADGPSLPSPLHSSPCAGCRRAGGVSIPGRAPADQRPSGCGTGGGGRRRACGAGEGGTCVCGGQGRGVGPGTGRPSGFLPSRRAGQRPLRGTALRSAAAQPPFPLKWWGGAQQLPAGVRELRARRSVGWPCDCWGWLPAGALAGRQGPIRTRGRGQPARRERVLGGWRQL